MDPEDIKRRDDDRPPFYFLMDWPNDPSEIRQYLLRGRLRLLMAVIMVVLRVCLGSICELNGSHHNHHSNSNDDNPMLVLFLFIMYLAVPFFFDVFMASLIRAVGGDFEALYWVMVIHNVVYNFSCPKDQHE